MSKVTSIEEMRNIEELYLYELIGSLQNYELSLSRWKKSKKQKDAVKDKFDASIALIHQEDKKLTPEEINGISDKTVDQLTRNYTKFLEKELQEKFSGCFGHIQAECANTLKKKKAHAATWSDSEEEKNSTVSEKGDGEGRHNAYKEMFAQWEYKTKQIKGLKSAMEQVETEKGKLEYTVMNLNMLLDEKDNEIYKLIVDLVGVPELHRPTKANKASNDTMVTWRKLQNLLVFTCYLSQIEPKSVRDALLDDFWLATMQDEMGNFRRLGVWIMVPRPDGSNVIGTK
uniref:Uncharacterized protein n=1 Tax=Cannabis sativa TaxID=3483 RepID=A0A803PHN9_CANSA